MAANSIRKHCSDEVLLAYADGELSALVRRSVCRHLEKCWECRARLNNLEQQAQGLARALLSEVLIPPQRVVEARLKLTAKQREMGSRNKEESAAVARFSGFAVRASCAAVMVCLLFVVWQQPWRKKTVPQWRQILARAEKQERQFADAAFAVHQTLQVEVKEVTPPGTARRGQVEIWSDFPGNRYALRWSDLGGTVKRAMWHSPGNQHLTYQASSIIGPFDNAPVHMEVQSMADLAQYGLGVETIEAAFWNLLRSRPWRPVSLSSDFSMFASAPGVLLAVQNNDSSIRLRAVRVGSGLEVEMVIEIDPRTFQPRLQRVRFTGSGRILEFRLVVGNTEHVVATALPGTVFRPDPSVWRSAEETARARVATRTSPGETPPISPRVTTSREQLAVEVLFALHRARACLGEPVEVYQDSHGKLKVSAILGSPERKAELLDALAAFPEESVEIDVRTVEEAADHQSDLTAASEAAKFGARTLPLEQHLRKYLSRESGETEGERFSRLANDVVSAGDSMLAEAWALRRLAERYTAERAGTLNAGTQRLLDSMVRDHVTALRWRITSTTILLRPFLSSIAGAIVQEAPAMWPNEDPALSLLQGVGHVNNLIRMLFAGDLPPGPPEDAGRGDDQSVLRRSAELLSALARLESSLHVFETGILAAFRGDQQASTTSPEGQGERQQ